MADICGDNRFEIIARAKQSILDGTNIDKSPDEMKVLDNFLFRCWQMDWLDCYDENKKLVEQKHGQWEEADDGDGVVCSVCGKDFCILVYPTEQFNYCPNCGAKMQTTE